MPRGEGGDKRILGHGVHKEISTKTVYNIMNEGGMVDHEAQLMWRSIARTKQKFFKWLVLKGRINIRERLHRQGVTNNAGCPFGSVEDETIIILLFECTQTQEFWRRLGVNLNWMSSVAEFLTHGDEVLDLGLGYALTMVVVVCWNIWLARNRKVFDDVEVEPIRVVSESKQELSLVKHRTRTAKLQFSISSRPGSTNGEWEDLSCNKSFFHSFFL